MNNINGDRLSKHTHESHDSNCDCGHDHVHDENCTHEHDQHSAHEHVHDENCDCGHDHAHDENCDCGHDHAHDENCDCGHDHSHDGHSTHDHVDTRAESITVTTHDSAIVGTVSKTISASLEQARGDVDELISALVQWLNKKEAIVGHIKAFVQAEGDSYNFSYTSGSVQENHNVSTGVQVSIAAIVFMVTVDELRETLEELVGTHL